MQILVICTHLLCIPRNAYLFASHALLGDYLEQRDCVAVGALEHLAHDRQQVPHALGLASAQRPQQADPFRGCRRRGGAQVVDVAENCGPELASRCSELGAQGLFA
jgi:hypothetical protein